MMTEAAFHHMSHSEAETEALASRLAQILPPSGIVILLDGDLGAGKSVVARGVIRGLGVMDDYITSPTFTLLNTYTEGRVPVYHFDLYRLSHPDELALTGVEEYLYPQGEEGVVLVEWADKGGAWIPANHLRIFLEYVQFHPEWRSVRITAQGSFAGQVLHAFQSRDTNE